MGPFVLQSPDLTVWEKKLSVNLALGATLRELRQQLRLLLACFALPEECFNLD